ncbi:MAG TPA: hypothetical protein VFR93_11240 [Candidatus Limnocylindrales bacterium]|nr:hypothetical protein [Candidatus Limnocylindrales bacterium]
MRWTGAEDEVDERTVGGSIERPIQSVEQAGTDGSGADGASARAPARDADSPLADPRALTILSTEHWSLLSARSLVYNEAFARAGMFLTFLSATLVALGLVAASMTFTRSFLLVTAVVLGVDLFLGVATMGRVATATNEDVRFLLGMNRIRHAYHEMVPGLERYFISGHHDDIRGVFEVYGESEEIGSGRGILHGFTTVVGMIGVICATIAGVLAGVLLVLLDAPGEVAGLGALATFVLGIALAVWAMTRQIVGFARSMRPIFPTPPDARDRRG